MRTRAALTASGERGVISEAEVHIRPPRSLEATYRRYFQASSTSPAGGESVEDII